MEGSTYPASQHRAGKLQHSVEASPGSPASTVEYYTPRTSAAAFPYTDDASSHFGLAGQAAATGGRRRLWDLTNQLAEATVYGPLVDIGAASQPLRQQNFVDDLGGRLHHAHGTADIPQPYIPQLTAKEAKRLAENRHIVLHRKVKRVLQPRQPPWVVADWTKRKVADKIAHSPFDTPAASGATASQEHRPLSAPSLRMSAPAKAHARHLSPPAYVSPQQPTVDTRPAGRSRVRSLSPPPTRAAASIDHLMRFVPAGTYRQLEEQFMQDYASIQHRLDRVLKTCGSFQDHYCPRPPPAWLAPYPAGSNITAAVGQGPTTSGALTTASEAATVAAIYQRDVAQRLGSGGVGPSVTRAGRATPGGTAPSPVSLAAAAAAVSAPGTPTRVIPSTLAPSAGHSPPPLPTPQSPTYVSSQSTPEQLSLLSRASAMESASLQSKPAQPSLLSRASAVQSARSWGEAGVGPSMRVGGGTQSDYETILRLNPLGIHYGDAYYESSTAVETAARYRNDRSLLSPYDTRTAKSTAAASASAQAWLSSGTAIGADTTAGRQTTIPVEISGKLEQAAAVRRQQETQPGGSGITGVLPVSPSHSTASTISYTGAVSSVHARAGSTSSTLPYPSGAATVPYQGTAVSLEDTELLEWLEPIPLASKASINKFKEVREGSITRALRSVFREAAKGPCMGGLSHRERLQAGLRDLAAEFYGPLIQQQQQADISYYQHGFKPPLVRHQSVGT